MNLTEPDQSGPATAYAQFRLANIWQARGKVSRAIAGYQEIIKTWPDYIPAQLELGNLLRQQGRVAEAEAHYRQAIVRNPREPFLGKKLADLIASRKGEGLPAPAPKVTPFHREPDRGRSHILLYTDRPGAYGAEQIGHMLMLHLVETGYAVTCAQAKASHHLIEQRQRDGIRHVWLADDDLYDATRTPLAFSNHAEAEEIFSSVKPDRIIFNDSCPVSNLAAKEVASQQNIPYIVVTHCVTAAWTSRFTTHLPRLPNLYRQAEAVVAVSQSNLDLLRQEFGLPADIGQVIINGRPASWFAPVDQAVRRRLRQQLHIPAEAVVVFTAGRLELVKGYQYQIKAIKRLKQRPVWPQLYFVWAGVGTLEAQLKAAVAQGGVETHVKLLGERVDIPDLLDSADIFLLPSEYEGMPLSLMEAMARGLPVVATAVSGIPEAVGDTGWLLPDPQIDSEATVDELVATVELLATAPDLRKSHGEAGRKRAASLFSGETMLASYLKLIRQTEV